jgi:hypothetical protein
MLMEVSLINFKKTEALSRWPVENVISQSTLLSQRSWNNGMKAVTRDLLQECHHISR